jgi:tRNA A37 threonylcarbamoyladenosine synthetase subunit TsaC/SUA5/YrdC
VRVPNHDALTTLCAIVGVPLTATSANRAGEPATLDPRDIARLFPDVPLLDGGVVSGGAPSTVVSVSEICDVTLVRAGAVPWSRARTIEEVLRG